MVNESVKTDIKKEMLECLKKFGRLQPPIKMKKGLNSLIWFEKLKEQRKAENRKKFSPTTFNSYIQKLVADGLIEKKVMSHKDVVYELVEEKSMQWALDGIANSIETFINLVEVVEFIETPATYSKYSITTIAEIEAAIGKNNGWKLLIENLTDEQLTKLQAVLKHLMENVDHYQKFKRQNASKDAKKPTDRMELKK